MSMGGATLTPAFAAGPVRKDFKAVPESGKAPTSFKFRCSRAGHLRRQLLSDPAVKQRNQTGAEPKILPCFVV